MILWFTYVKGAWRALTGKFGAGITFKTTLKGAGKLLDSVLGDLWMPGSCFILSAISLGYGIKELVCPPAPLPSSLMLLHTLPGLRSLTHLLFVAVVEENDAAIAFVVMYTLSIHRLARCLI